MANMNDEMRKVIARSFIGLLSLFILMNIVAAFHAYKFTHFADTGKVKTKNSKQLSVLGKVDAILFGVSNPRPVNKKSPLIAYETIKLKSNKEIEENIDKLIEKLEELINEFGIEEYKHLKGN